MNARHSGEEIKMCWSKLRDQTKTGSQQINNDKITLEFPEASSKGGKGKKQQKSTQTRGKKRTDKDDIKETWKEKENTWRKT